MDKAKSLLAKGDVASGFTFRVLTVNDPQRIQVVEAIQSQLGGLGIKVQGDFKEVSQYSDTLRKGDYDAVLLFWAGRVDPDGSLYAWYHPKGLWDAYGYNNPDVSSLLDQARTQFNLDTRKTLYEKVQKLIDQDMPMVYLVHDEAGTGLSKKLQNFVAVPDGVMRFTDVWLKP
jgi:peptide/nickel transport system substrate-binding protein